MQVSVKKKNLGMLEIGDDGKYYIVQFDDDGKEISRQPATIMPEQKNKPKTYFKKGEFALMAKLLMKMLKKKKGYNNLTFRLLFELMERIDFNNRIKTFRQVELAQELEAKQPHVSTSLRILEQDGIIVKREHDYYFTEKFVQFASDRKVGKNESQQSENMTAPTDLEEHEQAQEGI
jgi:predicted transcriptional regulator